MLRRRRLQRGAEGEEHERGDSLLHMIFDKHNILNACVRARDCAHTRLSIMGRYQNKLHAPLYLQRAPHTAEGLPFLGWGKVYQTCADDDAHNAARSCIYAACVDHTCVCRPRKHCLARFTVKAWHF